jgi:hypothetical protein
VIPCYVFITRSWIMSTRAKTLYLICALSLPLCSFTIVALHAAMIFADVPLERSFVVRVVALPILLSGVFGTATLWVVMWYHWFGYNKDSELSKGFWLVCFILFGPLASIFYYFFPYRWSFRSILET